jgi:hypothetical protein
MKKVMLGETNVGDIIKFTKDGDQFVVVLYRGVDFVGINGSSQGAVLNYTNITETEKSLVWLVREYR